MTGLWAVPSRQRYLPMLAGPLLDALSASLLFLLLFAKSESVFRFAPEIEQLMRAMIFLYLLRLLWQCYFFMRTDFYFVFTTFFGCKNLMKDTQNFVNDFFRRATGSAKRVDQSHIPLRERRVIQMYSVLWLLGRGVAFFSLFFITLPVLYRYLDGTRLALQRGYAGNHYQFFDAVLVGSLNLAPLIIGLYLWLASIVRRREAA